MAHAQKLIPLEQLLSECFRPVNRAQKPPTRPSIVSGSAAPDARRPSSQGSGPNFVSPFAADSARKGAASGRFRSCQLRRRGRASSRRPVPNRSSWDRRLQRRSAIQSRSRITDVATLCRCLGDAEPEREPPPRVEEKSVAVAAAGGVTRSSKRRSRGADQPAKIFSLHVVMPANGVCRAMKWS